MAVGRAANRHIRHAKSWNKPTNRLQCKRMVSSAGSQDRKPLSFQTDYIFGCV